MTGFASVGDERPQAAIDDADHDPRGGMASGSGCTVDARSVNGRFLDITIRLPDEWRGLEPGIREAVTARVRRGKVEVRVGRSREVESPWPAPRPDQLSRLANLEESVRSWLPRAAPLSVQEALQWCRSAAAPAARDDEQVMRLAREAVAALVESRAREGAQLARVMREKVDALRGLADRAEPLVPQAVARQRERFIERWNEALAAASGTAPSATEREALDQRAAAEAVAYAVRIDVAEELARLRTHLDAVERLLVDGGEVGKRLEFLIQELQREANTLGSKSTSVELTAIAVDMKVLVEQLREQVQNIE